MSLSEQTQKLTQDFITSQSSENQAIIKSAFTEIAEAGFGVNALKAGEQAKLFTLPNTKGGQTALSDLLSEGPVVISFYRGGWCPFCNLEFKALSDALPAIKKAGAKLVGVSPELPDNSMSTVEQHKLEFEVLSDVGNQIARDYGLVMDVPECLRPLYLQWGLDVPACNGDDTWELPIPATYVIDGSCNIVLAYVNANYTERLEPDEILKALETI